MSNYAYVASGPAGLRIIDVSSAEHPRITGQYDTPGDARDVVVKDNIAYVADASGGLQIINVTDPKAPSRISAYTGTTPGGTFISLEFDSGFAYTVNVASELQIIDLRDPRRPRLLNSFKPGIPTERVHLSRPYVFLSGYSSGFIAVELTRDWKAIIKSSVTGISVSGLAFGSNTVYVSGASGLSSFDFSYPAVPIRRGTREAATALYDVVLKDSMMYAASADGRILVIEDRKEPLVKRLPEDQVVEEGVSAVQSVVPDAAGYTFRWFKDGEALVDSARVKGTDSPSLTIQEVSIADSGQFSVSISNEAGQISTAPATLTVVPRQSNPLKFVGAWPGYPRGEARRVAVCGTSAILAVQDNGLLVRDISDPFEPRHITTYRTRGNSYDVTCNGTLAGR